MLFRSKTQGNGGLDLDNCGNVYVGSGNGVYKFDANLNFISSATTPGPVYDVDVSANGDVAASGSNFVAAVTLSACSQQTNVCGTSLVASVSTVNATCQGSCNGSASVNVTSGTAPYNYAWSNGSTGASVTGLCAGNYTVTVTDAASVSTTQNFVIGQLSAVVATALCTQPDNCSLNNGVVSASATGGSGAGYTFSWSTTPIQTGSQLNGLSAGTYTVTVTDAAGCTAATTVVVPALGGPVLQISNTSNVLCNGGSNGSASVTVKIGRAHV